jgi:hypothetical protein
MQAIFPFDMTLVQATCTACGTTKPLGATVAPMHGTGTVARCPVCDNALIRVALVQSSSPLEEAGSGRERHPSRAPWLGPPRR